MSSNSIYPHVPYFYIIEHVASGKRYAGSRWAKGCNPVEFMTEGGYCTSSNVVKKTIKEEGLESFKIIEIKTIDEVGNVYDYETDFLVENDCAKSNLWFNRHDNTGLSTTGTEEFKTLMINKFGVEHPMQSEKIKEKSRQTNLKRRGVEYSLQAEDVREKGRQTNLKLRGVENPMHSEEVLEKIRNTMLKNHGVDHQFKSKDVREKSRQTLFKNRGVNHNSQCAIVKESKKKNSLIKYGVDNYAKTKEHKERTSKLNNEKFDVIIKNAILNGDFRRFEYLYDTVEHVFLMGIEKSLNRGCVVRRFIKIGTPHGRGSKKYIDVLTGKTYKINASNFHTALPDNFIRGTIVKQLDI